MNLKQKLLITFLSIALIPTLIVGFIASYISSSSLEHLAFSELIAVREIKKSQIENYFVNKKHDIDILAQTIQKILDTSSLDAVNQSVHDNHTYFENYINTFGFYDFFLIDDNGEIFYTVAKEADYQTNLVSGAYSSSGLGKLYSKVKASGQFGMVDFSRYAPSNNEPAGFIALPFTTSNGLSLVVALQLSIERINSLMQQRTGMGDTGESYLIGTDLLMRSDSFLDPKGHSVLASFAGNVKQNGVDTESARLGASGKTGEKIVIDYNGNPVLSAFTPVKIHGINWVLLSEIDVAEALAPVDALYLDIFIIIVLCIVVIVIIAFMTSKAIMKPLGGEPDEMQKISETIADGNLTVAFDDSREASSVYGAMHRMANHLRSVIAEIIEDSNHLSRVASQTSSLSSQTNESLLHQRSSIEQVATAVEEMSVSINEVAQNATMAASSAQTAQGSSTEAHSKLIQTVDDLGRLDSEISQASSVIQELEKDSYEIGSVLEVIRGIADQTNLLALNAAIEAARAGEQGRGFAVVADEVRTLASKTQESTKNIEEMIGKLQNASNEAVKVMSVSRNVCENTINNAHEMADVIKGMNEEIDNITQMTELIATAVEEQSCVSSEISQNITSINDVAHENTNASEQVASASTNINNIAEELNKLTQKFKVS